MQATAQDPTIADLVSRLDDDAAELYSERAGIREFDAGTSRELAEALALADVLERYPDALSELVVFQIEVDGEPHCVVATDLDRGREHVAKSGATNCRTSSVARVVQEQFGGLAELTSAA